MKNLIDTDGENQAVRAFLQMYGIPGLTAEQMHDHMCVSGYKGTSPEWVFEAPGFLTKGGAQHWLRKLFALELDTGYAELLGELAGYRAWMQQTQIEMLRLEETTQQLKAELAAVNTEANYG